MEHALRQRRHPSELAGLAQPSLFRAPSIEADLEDLSGHGWVASLPLLPAGETYAARVEWAAHGALLIAHCYTRYLADLNGGALLRQRLTHSFGADFRALAFHGFPEIQDLASFRGRYRASLDRAGERLADDTAVVEEAAVAFEMNIQLSLEVNAFRWPVRA